MPCNIQSESEVDQKSEFVTDKDFTESRCGSSWLGLHTINESVRGYLVTLDDSATLEQPKVLTALCGLKKVLSVLTICSN